MNAKDIKKIRLLLGLSQERLARELGVSFCTVNRWEKGRTTPSPMAVEKLKRFEAWLGTNKFTDKRSFERMDVKYPIQIKVLDGASSEAGNHQFESSTVDFSIGGLKFNTEQTLAIGDALRIDIAFAENESPVEVDSDIRWTKAENGSREVGVSFGEFKPGDLEKFRTALNMRPVVVN
ncbi:MAG: PilZ domain-containing protein [Thermodesulfobacteriota bacterium]